MNISIRLNENSLKKLKKYGEITGIGYCNLLAIGGHIILSVFESIEKECSEFFEKPFEDVFARFEKYPYKNAFIPLREIINNEQIIIDENIRNDIMDIIIDTSRKKLLKLKTNERRLDFEK